MKKLIELFPVLVLLLFAGSVLAGEVDLPKLEKEMWGLAQQKKWDKLEARFAPTYLMVDERGVSDLKSTMKALKKMDLQVFSLTDFRVTQTENTAVLTYKADVTETIGGKRIRKQNAPRVTVWVKTDKGWRNILHANFNPLDKPDTKQ